MIFEAAKFAQKCHEGQLRKYSGDPYIVHPGRVANKVLLLDSTEDMVCAAWLHDVAEDCGISYEELLNTFSPRIARYVDELTNKSKLDSKLNRAQRKQVDCERISKASKEARIIKLCDRIDNFRDIPNLQPFKKKYAEETNLLLNSLRGTDHKLEYELRHLLIDFKNLDLSGCSHVWKEEIDSQSATEDTNEVKCTKCGMCGELTYSTGEVYYPAT